MKRHLNLSLCYEIICDCCAAAATFHGEGDFFSNSKKNQKAIVHYKKNVTELRFAYDGNGNGNTGTGGGENFMEEDENDENQLYDCNHYQQYNYSQQRSNGNRQ